MFQFEIEDATVVDGKSVNVEAKQIEDVGFSLEEKIRCGKDLGVVKYIGPVGSYQGIWLGIEWDDPLRGKHSGTVEDVEYFKVSVPNSASFIRPLKAQKLRKLMQGLRERYGEDEGTMSTVKSIENRLEKKKISFEHLKVLNLSSRGINDLSEWKELTETCPVVEVLEIADNLITDWDSIGNLCLAMTKLIRIDLSRNPIARPTDEEVNGHKNSFSKLQHMILGGVNYDWPTILKASLMWPHIIDLTIPFNSISDLSEPKDTLQNLKSIDFEKNLISDWKEVLRLTVLERLEVINLCGNELTQIQFQTIEDRQSFPTYFPNLVRLNLTENSINDWISVSELNNLPKLSELRIDMNPILNHEIRTTNREIIIARLPKLHKLEGVDITRQERRDSELDFVKMYSRKWAVEADRPKFILENPIYPELVKKYGLSESGEISNNQPNTMKSSLITLIIVPESAISSEKINSRKEYEKKILKTMTVQKLKGLLQRMFKIPSVPIEIIVTSCQNSGITFTLEDDFLELGQYSVDNGDTLRVRW